MTRTVHRTGQTTVRRHQRIIVCAALACFLALMPGCSQSKSADTQNSGGGRNAKGGRGGGGATPVGVAPVTKQDVPVILTGLGTITAYNTVTVRSRVDGQLTKVNFQEGQFIKEGDLLAVIDPRPYEVALQQAQAALARDQAQYDTSKANLARNEQLVKEGIIAVQQLDTQRAETGQFAGTIQLDQAQIENAKLNLSYTHITAPVSGRIGLRLVDAGNIVHASDQNGMLVITQMQPIAVLFTLPEDDIPQVVERLHSGELPVEAFDSDDKNKLAAGKLQTIDNQIDPTTATVRLKAVFDNRDSVLWPNQFVNIHLQLRTIKDATVIPSSALQHGQQGAYVFSVDSSNKAQMHNVQVELTQGDTTVLASGVAPGDRVVTDGQDRLSSGSPVEPTSGQGGRRNQNAQGQTPAANGAPESGGNDSGQPSQRQAQSQPGPQGQGRPHKGNGQHGSGGSSAGGPGVR